MEQTKINQLPQESGVSGVTCATVRAQINIPGKKLPGIRLACSRPGHCDETSAYPRAVPLGT